MASRPDGGPAFPRQEHTVDYHGAEQYFVGAEGMSLRDWFAGQAMTGWLATYGDAAHPAATGNARVIAEYAYAIADAMLTERSRSDGQS